MSCGTTVSCLNSWRSLRPLDGTDKTRWLEMAKNSMTNKQRNAQSQRDRARNKQQPRRQRSGVTSTVVANRAYVGTMPGPRMRSSPSGGMMVCNTEELISAKSSDTTLSFTASTTPLIPSQASWLAGVARSFSKFRWCKLRVSYLPAVGTGIAGRLAASLVYDANDLSPSTMAQVIAGYRATFGPVWAGQSGFDSTNPFSNHADMVHLDLDCSRLGKRYYPYTTLTNYTAMSLTDRTIYAPAELLTAIEGVVATGSVVGSFYISYEIELVEPIAATVNG
uniref:Capsid protein n=1 Tax=Erysiphe necator associated sobemo-like virus 4 TaxID=2744806 RepID=A0A8E3Z206_9VIRU|nr:capsid protein [Erysiphe necator associated sobemo-like virus 4]